MNETRKVRFTMNAMGFNRFEVYDIPIEEAESYIGSGIAVEVETPAEVAIEEAVETLPGDIEDGV